MNRPNFFIVGAPKCGTTAMNEFLEAHPEIFMAEKELHFFGRDLPIRDRISFDDYMAAFAAAKGEKIIGEASVWYLFSETAAREIRDRFAEAKILIMVRNPVDMLLSLHNQHLLDGNEVEGDPEKAIFREEGRGWAKEFFHTPSYSRAIDYAAGIKRFWEIFGKDKVQIILHDDLKQEPEQTYRAVLRFLQADESFQPVWKGVNERRHIRWLPLHRLFKNPPPPLRALAAFLFPNKGFRHRLMYWIWNFNVRPAAAQKISPRFRKRLNEFAKPQVEELSALLQRDLQHWLRP